MHCKSPVVPSLASWSIHCNKRQHFIHFIENNSMKRTIKNLFTVVASALLVTLFSSCDDEQEQRIDPLNPGNGTNIVGADITTAGTYESKDNLDFYIGYTVGYNARTNNFYLHQFDKLDDPNVTIVGGKDAFPLVSDARAPHAYRSSDGFLYSLTYRVGDITNVIYNKATKKFELRTTVRSQNVIGNSNMRFALLPGTHYSSVHEISPVRFDASGQVLGKDATGTAASIGGAYNIVILDNTLMKLGNNNKGTVSLPELDKQGYFISRIHTPVITGSKIYYGTQISKIESLDKVPGKKTVKSTGKTATLIFDYPSFKNPKTIFYKEEVGSTTGYRSRNMFLAEDGKTIYQLTGFEGGKVYMLKIQDGEYQDWSIDIAGKCGHSKARSIGWFYAGDGIAFVPYEKGDAKPITNYTDPHGNEIPQYPWGIARVDLNTGEVLDLEVPSHTYFFQYQEAAIRNGKIYFAITPVGNNFSSYDGNVYIWDVKNTQAKPQLGAKLVSGSDNVFTAIF